VYKIDSSYLYTQMMMISLRSHQVFYASATRHDDITSTIVSLYHLSTPVCGNVSDQYQGQYKKKNDHRGVIIKTTYLLRAARTTIVFVHI